MRLQCVVVLALVAFAQTGASLKRLLRSTTDVAIEEERGALTNAFMKLINPEKAAAAAAVSAAVEQLDDPAVSKALGTSLLKTFKSVNSKSADDIFKSKAFGRLENYVSQLNNRGKESSVARVFSSGLGDTKAMELFFSATMSSDKTMQKTGHYFSDQLMRQWAKDGKTWDEVATLIPRQDTIYFKGKYTETLMQLAGDAQLKTTALAKAERAAAATAAATAKTANLDDPVVAKSVAQSLVQRFEATNPTKLSHVDDLFKGKALDGVETYVYRLNRRDINDQTTVTKFLSSELGEKAALQFFLTASTSKIGKVRENGEYFRNEIIRQWVKDGESWNGVAALVPAQYYSYVQRMFANAGGVE